MNQNYCVLFPAGKSISEKMILFFSLERNLFRAAFLFFNTALPFNMMLLMHANAKRFLLNKEKI